MKFNQLRRLNIVKTRPVVLAQIAVDFSKITNELVRAAIEALQSGDRNWYAYFIDNPEMTDGGDRVNFKDFFINALGKERFLSIDRVAGDGKEVYGNFQAGHWGTFNVVFKFHINAAGKFYRLDIGQTVD